MNKALYEMYKAHNICVRCGYRDTFGNGTRCPDCRDKEKEYRRKHYNTHINDIKAKAYKYTNEQYKRRKSLNLCVRCGKRKSETNKSRCIYCLIKAREYSRQARLRRSEG